MQQQDELTGSDRRRADSYKLLSACFCTPGKEFIEEGLIDHLSAALESACPTAVPYAKAMSKALFDYDLRTQILVDYSALFIGPFALLAPPYGSVYLEKEKMLMGDTTMDAVRTYRDAGVEMDTDAQRDMPDHISVELEFMYYLIMKELEALENGNSAEAAKYAGIRKDFLKRHLGAWAFDLATKMREHAKTTFYGNLADCVTAFLLSEIQKENIATSPAGKA